MKNFEVCPKRHYEIDLVKSVKEPEGEQLKWGNFVHDQMAKRCAENKPLDKELLAGLPHAEHWAQEVVGDGTGEYIVEQSIALNKNFTPVGNFDSDVWLRTKCDFIRIRGDVAIVVDWKTGKIVEEPVQLALVAACVFAKYPQVNAIRSMYVWLKEDAKTTETFYREDVPNIWRSVWPRIEAMEQAHQFTNYPPKPSGMCLRWCAVKACPHNGKPSGRTP